MEIAVALRRPVKRACRSFIDSVGENFLRRLGYEVRRKRRSRDRIAARTVTESEYYTDWSTSCPMWTPWLGDPEFRAAYEGVEPHTLVSPDRCHVLWSLARHASELEGDFAECGVYTGGTALLLARATGNGRRRTLYLFDSFEGLPAPDPERDNSYREGDFAVDSVESVRQLLSEADKRIAIRQGWIPETFRGLEDLRFAFVHVDVDLYRSALDCCNFFYPRVVPGGILLFDEYGFPATRGEKEAVDEFFADKPEVPIPLRTGQALVIRLNTPARGAR